MRMLFDRRLRWFLLFPVGMMLMLLGIITYFAFRIGVDLSDGLLSQFKALFPAVLELEQWEQYVGGAAFFFSLFTLPLAYFLFFTFGGYLLIMLLSPVYSFLSERVEYALSGTTYVFNWRQWVWSVLRGIGVTLRCLLFQGLWTLLLLLLSFLPLGIFVTPVLAFLLSAYFYGVTFMDYAVERRGWGVGESMCYMRRNRGSVLGIGVVFSVALLIPFVRIFVSAFVSLLAVVAGTIVVERNHLNR